MSESAMPNDNASLRRVIEELKNIPKKIGEKISSGVGEKVSTVRSQFNRESVVNAMLPRPFATLANKTFDRFGSKENPASSNPNESSKYGLKPQSEEESEVEVDAIEALADHISEGFEETNENLSAILEALDDGQEETVQLLEVNGGAVNTIEKETKETNLELISVNGTILRELKQINKNTTQDVLSQKEKDWESRKKSQEGGSVSSLSNGKEKTPAAGGFGGFMKEYLGARVAEKVLEKAAGLVGSVGKNLITRIVPQLGPALLGAAPLAAMYGVTNWAENASITNNDGTMTNTGIFLDKSSKLAGGDGMKPDSSKSESERISEKFKDRWWESRSSKNEKLTKEYKDFADRGVEISKSEFNMLQSRLGPQEWMKDLKVKDSSVELKPVSTNEKISGKTPDQILNSEVTPQLAAISGMPLEGDLQSVEASKAKSYRLQSLTEQIEKTNAEKETLSTEKQIIPVPINNSGSKTAPQTNQAQTKTQIPGVRNNDGTIQRLLDANYAPLMN